MLVPPADALCLTSVLQPDVHLPHKYITTTYKTSPNTAGSGALCSAWLLTSALRVTFPWLLRKSFHFFHCAVGQYLASFTQVADWKSH